MSKEVTARSAMKLALEALNAATRYGAGGFEDAKDALREELAKPDFWEGYVPEPMKPRGEATLAQQGPVFSYTPDMDAVRRDEKEKADKFLAQLAQQALDKKAENARELGLDYEPAQQEPVAHAVIAGALFDFMGWLTSRKERLVLSSADNASPAVEAITEFAKMRGLSLNDAKVQDWNTSPPAQHHSKVWPSSHWTEYERSIAAAEREACAKVCDIKAEVMAITGKSCDPDDLAAAIRSRSSEHSARNNK